MNAYEEFLKHAADCEQMAMFTRDPASRSTWKGMAERWRLCDETFSSQREAAQQHAPTKRYRRNIAPGWAQPMS
jgi:hypothetical protein